MAAASHNSISDQEIAQALETLLRDPNPNLFTSLNAVVHQLESRLGRNLSHKFDFIRTQIHHALLRSQPHPVVSPSPSPTPNSNPNLNLNPHQPPLHLPPQHQQQQHQVQQQHQHVFMQPQPGYRDHFAFRQMQHQQHQQGFQSGPSSYVPQYLSFGSQPPPKTDTVTPPEPSRPRLHILP